MIKKGKRIMKKYIRITNLSAFPEFAGVVINKGNMRRSFCQCGFVACNVIDVCPSCGNEKFVYLPLKKERWVISKINNDIYFTQMMDTTDISENNQEETIIQTNSCVWTRGDFTACPNAGLILDSTLPNDFPEYRMAREIVKSYLPGNEKDKKVCLQWWRPVSELCRAVFQHGKQNQKNYTYLKEWVDFFRDSESLRTFILGNTQIVPWLQKIESLPMSILQCCRDGSVIRYFNQETIRQIENIPSKILDVLYSYYMCRYVNTIGHTLHLLVEDGISEDNADAFVKFFKERYANGNLGAFICWLNEGNEFKSVKDYYLQINRKQISEAYPTTKIDRAFENVYEDPAGAIINLANL